MSIVSLYSTAAKSKVPLAPIEDHLVTVYTCGPTVYLDPHIGNWRAFVFYDTLVRVLRDAEFDVEHVLNITDVGHLVSDEDSGEDKLQKQAKATRQSAWQVAEIYTKAFLEGMKQLNIVTPTSLPKATDNIAEQIELIQELEAKGHTYQIEDGIYFDTASWPHYGRLFNQSTVDEDFARIAENQQKRNQADFALWKFSPKDQKRDMQWNSPWGIGFPGWHIECSAMARKYLGKTIDIHAGGVDHIPIHHTNEVAQSEAANDCVFASIWLHCRFMMVDGTKMSKSKGNFYTLGDVVEHGFSAMDFRMLLMQGHYRTETNFTWATLSAAHNTRANILGVCDRRWQTNDKTGVDIVSSIEQATQRFREALYDDLNTPRALAELQGLLNEVEKTQINSQSGHALNKFLSTADMCLGLQLLDDSPDINESAKSAITERVLAKQAGDFAKADTIRSNLQNEGIELLDTQQSSYWCKVR